MDIIRSRRSIRRFLPDEVKQEDIEGILEAAMFAPSAGNQRPWEFIVVKNEARREQMSKAGPYSRPAAKAPVVILNCGDSSRETHKNYWPVDCSAATENMLLEATARNLGSVWLGVYPRQERMEYFITLISTTRAFSPFCNGLYWLCQ
jgi:nitroreductase